MSVSEFDLTFALTGNTEQRSFEQSAVSPDQSMLVLLGAEGTILLVSAKVCVLHGGDGIYSWTCRRSKRLAR